MHSSLPSSARRILVPQESHLLQTVYPLDVFWGVFMIFPLSSGKYVESYNAVAANLRLMLKDRLNQLVSTSRAKVVSVIESFSALRTCGIAMVDGGNPTFQFFKNSVNCRFRVFEALNDVDFAVGRHS